MNFPAVKTFMMNKLEKELPAHCTYHNIHHIRDVYTAAEWLADEEGVSENDRLLLLTAVLFHDAGFLVAQKDHEERSCEIALRYLPDFDYTETEISIICGMIMSTQIPQQPHNLLEEIICDADLDYLGRDDFYSIGRGLFDEFSFLGVVKSEEDWNRLQVNFLENHQYHTATAKRLRKEVKEKHLRELKLLLKAA